MAPEPVQKAAPNLAMAIARLANKAYRMDLIESGFADTLLTDRAVKIGSRNFKPVDSAFEFFHGSVHLVNVRAGSIAQDPETCSQVLFFSGRKR